jgi:hypothetical protein
MFDAPQPNGKNCTLVHKNSVSDLAQLPRATREFLEHYEGNEEGSGIALTAWPIANGLISFAGLQFINRTPWLVRGVIARNPASGLLDVRRLSVEPWRHESEVTGRVLRAVRPAEVRAAALAQLRFEGTEPFVYFGGARKRPVRVFPPSEQKARGDLIAAASHPRKRGRPPRPEAHYRDVALEYLEIYEGGSRTVLKELAERRGIPRQTVRDWVARARQIGYLAPGKQGRAGGTPGARLIAESGARRRSTKS